MSAHGHHHVFHPQPVGEIPVDYASADLDGFGPYGPELVNMTKLVDVHIGPSKSAADNEVKSALFTVGEYLERLQHGDAGHTAEGLNQVLQEQAATLTDDSLPILARLSVDLRLEHDDARELLDDDRYDQSRNFHENYFTLRFAGATIQSLVEGGLRDIDEGAAYGDGVYDDYVRMEGKLYQDALRERRIAKSDYSQRFHDIPPSMPVKIMEAVDSVHPVAGEALKWGGVVLLGGVATGSVIFDFGGIDVYLPEVGGAIGLAGGITAFGYFRGRERRPVKMGLEVLQEQLERGVIYDLGFPRRSQRQLHYSLDKMIGLIRQKDDLGELTQRVYDSIPEVVRGLSELPEPISNGGHISTYFRVIIDAIREQVRHEEAMDSASAAGYAMAITRRIVRGMTPDDLYAYVIRGNEPPPPPPEPVKPKPGDDGGEGPATGPNPKGRRLRRPRVNIPFRGGRKGRGPAATLPADPGDGLFYTDPDLESEADEEPEEEVWRRYRPGDL